MNDPLEPAQRKLLAMLVEAWRSTPDDQRHSFSAYPKLPDGTQLTLSHGWLKKDLSVQRFDLLALTNAGFLKPGDTWQIFGTPIEFEFVVTKAGLDYDNADPSKQLEALSRPRLLIGSSSEGTAIAEAIQSNLDREAESVVWHQGVFGLGQTPLESLAKAVQGVDFAVLVLTPDDTITKRRKTNASPRDNVLFELGLFMGVLGPDRTFMVAPENTELELPSDLAGVTQGRFRERSDDNLRAALGSFCTELKGIIHKRGIRSNRL
jgi:predicted nucleotide-binding protein